MKKSNLTFSLNKCFKVVAVLFISQLFILSSPTFAADDATLPPKALVKELQRGGLVLYIRHAATDHSQKDKDLSDLTKCELQRNLSQQGKNESKVMGEAIKALDIKIADVYTSPYCRCVDTAQIAFGRYEIINDLSAAFSVNQKDSKQLKSSLKQLLSTKPKQGFNTVLLSHTANLKELTNVWPKPEGVAHIFKPLGANGYQHMGRIPPKIWKPLLEMTQ